MPIRFRCSYCNRLLGIATRKAGTQTTCPHCGYQITVPVPNTDDSKTEHVNLDDVDELLGRGVTEAIPAPAVATAPSPAAPPASPSAEPLEQPRLELPPEQHHPDQPPAPKPHGTVASPAHGGNTHRPATPPVKPRPNPPPIPKAAPKAPANPDERPLLENDVDDILGKTAAPQEEQERAKPPTSGMDALSLGDPVRNIVISAPRATMLMVAVVVLMALSFAAGYFLAPKG